MNWLKRHKRILLEIIIVLFALMVGDAMGSSGQTANTPTATQSAQTQTSTTPPSTAKSATQNPTPAPSSPKELFSQSGNGTSQTSAFTTTASWRLVYTYDCSSLGTQGNFAVDINNTNGSDSSDTGVNELGMNELGKSGGNTSHYYNDSGSHYLKIISECKW